MIWIYYLIGGIFILLGLPVHRLKWYFLIAGYNTMPKEKKANVDTEGLGRLMGIYSYVNGGAFLLTGLLYACGLKPGPAPAILLLLVSNIYLLIKAPKYDGNIYDQEGKLRQRAGKKSAFSAAFAAATLIFVAVLMFFFSRPTKVTFLEEGLQIHGLYGELYSWESIDEARLMEELPAIERRTNGSAVGSHLKGHFRTKELGPVKMFVDAQKPPFIYLEADGRVVIFNMKSAPETRETFREILKHIE